MLIGDLPVASDPSSDGVVPFSTDGVHLQQLKLTDITGAGGGLNFWTETEGEIYNTRLPYPDPDVDDEGNYRFFDKVFHKATHPHAVYPCSGYLQNGEGGYEVKFPPQAYWSNREYSVEKARAISGDSAQDKIYAGYVDMHMSQAFMNEWAHNGSDPLIDQKYQVGRCYFEITCIGYNPDNIGRKPDIIVDTDWVVKDQAVVAPAKRGVEHVLVTHYDNMGVSWGIRLITTTIYTGTYNSEAWIEPEGGPKMSPIWYYCPYTDIPVYVRNPSLSGISQLQSIIDRMDQETVDGISKLDLGYMPHHWVLNNTWGSDFEFEDLVPQPIMYDYTYNASNYAGPYWDTATEEGVATYRRLTDNDMKLVKSRVYTLAMDIFNSVGLTALVYDVNQNVSEYRSNVNVNGATGVGVSSGYTDVEGVYHEQTTIQTSLDGNGFGKINGPMSAKVFIENGVKLEDKYLTSGSGGTGLTDVKIDGTSVKDGDVAKIKLGSNMTFENGVLNSTGGGGGGATYTAGNGIDISQDNVISAKYKAGTGVTIANDFTISASGKAISAGRGIDILDAGNSNLISTSAITDVYVNGVKKAKTYPQDISEGTYIDITNDDFEEVKYSPMPDYSFGAIVLTGRDFIPTDDGILYFTSPTSIKMSDTFTAHIGVSGTDFTYCRNIIPVKKGKSYYINGSTSGKFFKYLTHDKNSSEFAQPFINFNGRELVSVLSDTSNTFTPPKDGIIQIYCNKKLSGGVTIGAGNKGSTTLRYSGDFEYVRGGVATQVYKNTSSETGFSTYFFPFETTTNYDEVVSPVPDYNNKIDITLGEKLPAYGLIVSSYATTTASQRINLDNGGSYQGVIACYNNPNAGSATVFFPGAYGQNFTTSGYGTWSTSGAFILPYKMPSLMPGKNITIENGIVSAEGEAYTAGTGIDISETNVISSTVKGLETAFTRTPVGDLDPTHWQGFYDLSSFDTSTSEVAKCIFNSFISSDEPGLYAYDVSVMFDDSEGLAKSQGKLKVWVGHSIASYPDLYKGYNPQFLGAQGESDIVGGKATVHFSGLWIHSPSGYLPDSIKAGVAAGLFNSYLMGATDGYDNDTSSRPCVNVTVAIQKLNSLPNS